MGKYAKHRPLVGFAAAVLALFPVLADANCRQALAIGLDISGSVDLAEYRLQLDGLAGALEDPDVRSAFLAIPDSPVRLYVFEWAGIDTQRGLIPWTDVTDENVLDGIAGTLKTTPRRPRNVATAIGRAMTFGAGQLGNQGDCWRQTMDLSGDGQSNTGPRPRDVKNGLPFNVTINALVIGSKDTNSAVSIDGEISLLTSYFKSEVIRGPDAFVEAALGFEEFQDAMARKLLKELETLAIGQVLPGDQ